MQARRWTATAADPDVAAAQIVVPSTPTKSRNGPCSADPGGLTVGDLDISDALRPYVRMKVGVEGKIDWNKDPSLRAME
jgi:hypothetical protein